MKRKVYLIGEIEKKFGSEFSMYADSYGDIIRNIDCNRPGFKEYLLKSHDSGIDFTINFAGKDIDKEELLIPLKEGDVTIAAIPAGSASEFGKIITGIFIFAISFMSGIPEGVAVAMRVIGGNLAMQGIQSMLAPDPATEADPDENYLYTGAEEIVVEGDPIPLLYGKLRVQGQPISVAVNAIGSSGMLPISGTNTGHGGGSGSSFGDPCTYLE